MTNSTFSGFIYGDTALLSVRYNVRIIPFSEKVWRNVSYTCRWNPPLLIFCDRFSNAYTKSVCAVKFWPSSMTHEWGSKNLEMYHRGILSPKSGIHQVSRNSMRRDAKYEIFRKFTLSVWEGCETLPFQVTFLIPSSVHTYTFMSVSSWKLGILAIFLCARTIHWEGAVWC